MNFTVKSLIIPLGVSFALVPSVGFAATDEEIALALFEETSDILEVEIDDEDLADSISDDLQYAIEEDVIDSEIVDELDDALENYDEADLDDLFDDNLEEQEQSWLEKSPELLNAFDLVKYEFHQCREQSVGGASECARGLGFKLQAASVQIALEGLEELRQSLETLSGTELEQAQALLAEEELRLAERLARAEEKLLRFQSGGIDAPELETAITKARDAGVAAIPESEESPRPGNGGQGGNGNPGQKDDQGSPGNSGQGNSGQGNGGQGNSGNDNKGNSGGNGNGGGNRGDRGND